MESYTAGSADSEENWILSLAESALKGNQYEARAWLLTARSLYKNSFKIQYELYQLEKTSRNLKDAANLLNDMLQRFVSETGLWDEIQQLTDALQSNRIDDKTQLLIDLFGLLPLDTQYKVLTKVADNKSDVIARASLMIVFLKRFPSSIPEFAPPLIRDLLKAEEQDSSDTWVNPYRRYLVYDVLPIILQSGSSLKDSDVISWLDKALQYYVNSASVTYIEDKGKSSSYYSGPALEVLTKLFEIFNLAARKLHWDPVDLSSSPRETGYQLVLNLTHRCRKEKDASVKIQTVHVGLVCFLRHLLHYIGLLQKEAHQDGSLGLVLVEHFTELPFDSDPSVRLPKKRKLEHTSGGAPQLQTAKGSPPHATDFAQHFLVASSLWDLMHNDEGLSKDFDALLRNSQSPALEEWLSIFETDRLLYQGRHEDALALLTKREAAPDSNDIRTAVQAACCHFAVGHLQDTCQLVFEIIGNLPPAPTGHQQLQVAPSSGATTGASGTVVVMPGATATTQVAATGPAGAAGAAGTCGGSRLLVVMTLREREMLPFCVQLLLATVKERMSATTDWTCSLIGHALVLLQYTWPAEVELFTRIINKIRSRGYFTYSSFLAYVTNVDILEEFAYLKSDAGGNVKLDILPPKLTSMMPQRAVTRGVEKGVQEDFKQAIEKQVSRCDENMDGILRTFFTAERQSLECCL